MKRKARPLTFLLILLILGFLLISGCSNSSKSESESESKPLKNVAITLDNVSQEYYQSMKEWSTVHTYYTIQNNGSEIINNYKIYFTVNCVDESIYHDTWYEKFTILPDNSHSGYAMIDIFGKRADTVKVDELVVNIYQ